MRIAVAALFLAACGGGGPLPTMRPETLSASWSIEEVDVRGTEVIVRGSVDVDEEARDLEIVDGRCATRSLGGGMWTRNRLSYRFSPADVGAALGCASRFGVRAKRTAVSLAGVSSYVPLRLELDAERGEEGERVGPVQTATVTFDGDEATVTVTGVIAPSLTLSVEGSIYASLIDSEESAMFRVPTEALVVAAVRNTSIRFFVGGAHTRVWPSLYVEDRLITKAKTSETAEEEASEG